MTELYIILSFLAGAGTVYLVMRDSVRAIQATLQAVLDDRKPKQVARTPIVPVTQGEQAEEGQREPTVIPQELRQAFLPPDINKLRSDAFERGEEFVKKRMEMHRIAEEMGNG